MQVSQKNAGNDASEDVGNHEKKPIDSLSWLRDNALGFVPVFLTICAHELTAPWTICYRP
jgi:hypothetical protein